MRIRTIKPEFWQHRMHKRLCLSASLLAAALLDFADDEGRFEAEGERIRGMLMPSIALEKAVVELLGELEAAGWLVLYPVVMDGVEVAVGQILAFGKHQVIQRPKGSLLRRPPKGWEKVEGKWMRVEAGRTEGGGLRSELGSEKGGVIDLSLTKASTVAGSVNEGDEQRESGVAGSISDESLGNGREWKGMEGKGTEGSGARAQGDGERTESKGLRTELGEAGGGLEKKETGAVPEVDGARGDTRPPGEAVIPTAGEVGMVCAMDGIDGGYGERFWRNMTNDHGWIRNGRLRKWRNVLQAWWGADREAWLDGSMKGSPHKKTGVAGAEKNGGGLPVWRRIEVLKKAILEHPANGKSARYEPRCSRVQKAGLAELERELAELERGGEVKSAED